ncbi:unnamed protein product [Vicia faba]|uniref:Glyoxylate reductase n=1 Tax=Vicia faba TaxID=3906 RepID=A0AAV0ZGY7_VICFA|nr:unnamed protein product [Vicia faba]
MGSITVLLVTQVASYLEQQLNKRYNLFRLWDHPQKSHFLTQHGASIRAVVGRSTGGADSELIDALPNLEIISSSSVGVDKIDLVKCKEKGIRVTNTPDVLTDEVADLTIGLILALLRRICECDRYVRSGNWKRGGYELATKFSGKTVGIIGLGRIGTAIAKRAEEQTHHIINREVISALGPKGFLINIGRGKHVDEPELISALLEGRLGGAGLDVYENEPHVPQELLGLQNVVLLPHVGSATVETRTVMADLVLGNLEAHFLGKPLLTPLI